ncbi:diacylglycerol kinase family protein [Candidatus Microgenomates bacterium]|nr:diacylglycerol kinase family protein [Candidatus Microgenomates bacterium]
MKEAFKSEPNFRIHSLSAVIVLILGLYFKISLTEWTILVLTIMGVICLELVNTAIESVVDMVSPKFSRLAKIAKDVSAAAVLISSLAAIAVGVLIFLPKII